MEPISVTPSAPPSSYDTSSTEAAMPARSTGALCMMVPDAAVMAAPMPAPSTHRLAICGISAAS